MESLTLSPIAKIDGEINLPGSKSVSNRALLLAALPFGASLSLLRGVAYGRMNAGRIALSANVEMAVRLGGALVAWQAGLGIGGVVLAISLSIAAGWAALAGLLPTPAADRAAARPMLRILILGALPFALLQVAQVMALDGDIFLASALLPAAEAGKLAALSLVQRIQFFACVALASVLLPGVVIAARTGKDALSAALRGRLVWAWRRGVNDPAARLICERALQMIGERRSVS